MVPEGGPSGDEEDGPTFRYSPEEDDQPLVAIVEAVASVRGVDVRDLRPLHHVIDIDELRVYMGLESSQFTRSSADADYDEREVAFHYEGCEVTVGPGTIRVRQE